MPSASNIITPANIRLLQTVAEQGSFSRAARLLGLVPSALSYRVRQLEETLDLLLFDRSGRQARPTEATMELLREGKRLLEEMDSITQRIRRVATGWEPHLTIVVENLLDMDVVLELCEAFYALRPPTRIKIREEVMTGTIEALTGGQADLALGVLLDEGYANPHIEHRPLGAIEFVYAVAAPPWRRLTGLCCLKTSCPTVQWRWPTACIGPMAAAWACCRGRHCSPCPI